jgi:regulator of sigma E protease
MGIIAAIIILGILVFVHELGHFLVAKYFRVGVLEFALGFGPVITRFQKGETTYTIRAIPLGGFVRMAGDDPRMMEGLESGAAEAGGASPIEGTQEELTPLQVAMTKDETRWFLKKAYLPRCAIVFAGPLFNFLFAWLLAAGMYFTMGLPTIEDGPVTIGMVQSGLPAELAGIKSGDRILSVGDRQIKTFKELVDVVRSSDGKELVFNLERPEGDVSAEVKGGYKPLSITVNPKAGVAELDVLEGNSASKPTYRIGISPALTNVTYEPVGLLGALDAGQKQVVNLSLQTLRVVKALLTGLISPQKTIGGPIEIIKQTAASANEGWLAIISMMIFLNVTLGVMNLLPIPVLDGGHLTLFTLELLRGRPLSLRVQEYATRVGMTVLLFLMIFAIGNDIRRALF